MTDQNGAPWDVAPAHVQLTLHGYALDTSTQVPQLFIYPAADYAAMNPRAAESIGRLEAILSGGGVPIADDSLPSVPFFNAGQVIAAREKLIQFQGGKGLRLVTQYAQDVSPINNGGLFYHFEGLSTDGRYYLVAILPVNLPFLAGGNNPGSTVPPGGLAFPPANAQGQDFENYYSRIAARIDSAPPEQFTPALTLLDSLIQSISYP